MAKETVALEAGEAGAPPAGWISVEAACVYIDTTRKQFYRKVADLVDVRKDGRRTKVSVRSLDRYMESLPKIPKRGLRHVRGVEPQKKSPPRR